MDFAFRDEQKTVGELARGILEKEMSDERVATVERSGEWFDRRLWATLAEAGLLGLAIGEDHGGMGYGILELCTLLGEVGRVVAPVPVAPALVLGALPVQCFGTDAQKARWLPPAAAGETVLTAAVGETGRDGHSLAVARADARDGGFVLTGSARFVPAADAAAAIVVPASGADGCGLFIVDPATAGVHLVPSKTSRGEVLCDLQLAGVQVDGDSLLGGELRSGAEVFDWLYQRAVVADCATQIGVSEKALEMTADYVREREQFGVPIGSFQAVQHRSADAFIDLQSMRWVTWRAAWRLSRDEPAARDVAVAKFWAAEAGARIAATAQHLHAGIGVDTDYPVHRYFLWSKALETNLGAATAQLVDLGRDMARTGAPEAI